LIDVECKYCGSLINFAKAVKLNIQTGEYEYICVNCAIKWDKDDSRLKMISTEDRAKLSETLDEF